MDGTRILMTGATGQVGLPVALALARDNDVVAIARFSDAAARERLEAAGIQCIPVDLARGDLAGVPSDVDYVVNFAVARPNRFDRAIQANCEATGLLMQHCRSAKAFLHCSSTAVYAPKGHDPIAEGDPLGDNHRALFPTYSIVKIATEAVARTCARMLGLPTVIARLNVPYGDNGGWPEFHVLLMQTGADIEVTDDPPTVYNPIHEDDIVAAVPKLFAAASVPATIVNLGGADVVSVEEWCAYLGELTGFEPTFVASPNTIPSVAVDTTRQFELLGRPSVNWRDGFRRMLETRHPDLLKG